MARDIFYHNTVKNLIAAFGSIFNNVRFMNDHDEETKVPLHFSQREKFVEYFQNKGNFDESDFETVLPRMGFELQGLNFAPERYNNPLSKMLDKSNVDETKYMFSRVPYDFTFNLFVATRKLEDSLKIVEQMVPFFTPELNISINDKEDYGIVSDIPVVLNSIGFEIDNEGTFEERRVIMWTLNFTMKAWMYSNTRLQTRIKETIVSLRQPDFDKLFSELTAEVTPRTASKDDVYEIIETKIDGV